MSSDWDETAFELGYRSEFDIARAYRIVDPRQAFEEGVRIGRAMSDANQMLSRRPEWPEREVEAGRQLGRMLAELPVPASLDPLHAAVLGAIGASNAEHGVTRAQLISRVSNVVGHFSDHAIDQARRSLAERGDVQNVRVDRVTYYRLAAS